MAFYDDIPNVADCSDVAQLYECALLTINNSKLLRDWVNGSETTNVTLGGQSMPSLRKLIQNINRVAGIATSISPGAVRPDNVTTQVDALGVLSVIISGLIENGGGLVTGSNGKLAVDFSDMPTDKFEKLLKALRLPIWLTGNTNFYVNKSHSAASDTLDEGRGLSAAKPFKTIQACVNYIANNYNMGPYTATIVINSGEYDPVTLGEFSRTTGRITLSPLGGNVSIKRTSPGFCVNVAGGTWQLENLKINLDINLSSDSPSNPFIGGVLVSEAASLVAKGLDVNIKVTGTNTVSRVAYAYSGNGTLSLEPSSQQAKITFNASGVSTLTRFGLATSGGLIVLNSSADANLNKTIICTGDYSIFAIASSKGSIQRSTVYPHQLSFSGDCTGKRYQCERGGTIDLQNAGPDYFPGTIAGTVESSTYSWYK